ncbi:MAG: TIGR02680 family protein [Ruminococcus sp.]|nr:TIGR02680 family protein [Ruminococcus sp.]
MERWQMNRLGFVNFWVYDVEEFSIDGGRLLLRGANGSGKSITTQSFIPYILDGDRLPSRLDPFGGKERKMDYYLIGGADSDKKENTGYIWLEFTKPQSGQYKTIGIGMRAKKGGDFRAWGFCLKDGTRIGDGFELYIDAGSQLIPHDPKTLKKLLGDDNIFIEKVVAGKHAEYKEMVAYEIFGITKNNIGDFDRLTNVLIQTRSSKLSSKENLKPEQLYNILNDSLQTLTDEDLRPMTDAMSKIENIQETIEKANKAMREVRYIADEYDRYNRYLLWIKAKRYLAKASEVSDKQKDHDSKKSDIGQSEKTIKETAKLLEAEEIKLADLQREKDSLDMSGIEEQVKRRNDSIEKLNENISAKEKKEVSLNSKKGQQNKKYIDKKERISKIDGIKYDIDKGLKEAAEYSDSGYPFYDYFYRELKDGKALEADSYRKECQRFLNELRAVMDKFDEQSKAREKYDESEKELSEAAKVRADKKAEAGAAEEQLNEQKDIIIEAIYRAAKENAEFTINEAFRDKLTDIISKYEAQGGSSYHEAMFAHYGYLKNDLSKLLNKAKAECNERKAALDDTAKQLEELLSADEPAPPRNEFKEAARKALSESGIAFKALYECIDFAPAVSEEMRIKLEAALTDTGLLDALIIKQKDISAAKEIIKDYDDSWFVLDNKAGDIDSPYFEISEDCEFKDEVRAILSKFHGIVKIESDGYYEYGITAGYANGRQVSYIGAENRRLYRERQIAMLREQQEAAKEAYDDALRKKSEIDSRISELNKEYAARPSTENINASLDLLNTARLELKNADSIYKRAEEKLSLAKQLWLNASQKVDEICSRYPQYDKKRQVFADALSDLSNFEAVVCSIIDLNKSLNFENQLLSQIDDSIDDLDSDIDEIDADIKKLERAVHEYEEIIRLCTEFLESPENIDIARRADELIELIESSSGKINDHKKTISKAELEKQYASAYLEDITKELTDLIEQENKLAAIFKEELDLGFVIKADEKTLKQCAEMSKTEIIAGDDKREISVIQDRLEKAFQGHNTDSTADYRLMSETMFENEDSDTIRARKKITLLWQNGSRITPAEFTERIKTVIEEDELLMKEEEQKMFKDILLGILSRKLIVKVDDSRRWIETMSSLMKGIETSQGQSFSLSWTAKKDLGENELPYEQLNKLLRMNRDMIRSDDIEKLTDHFRSKIEHEKRVLEEKGEDISFSELIRRVLDYRNWFEFKLNFKESGSDSFRELTNSRFSSFSGGERAMSVYIPLFAAVAAQYQKTGEGAPMILALDEAFAGVDDSNISEMFDLLEKLGFGYIINSQSLWGCFKTVPKLNIAELRHEKDSDFITVIRYEWDGKVKELVE